MSEYCHYCKDPFFGHPDHDCPNKLHLKFCTCRRDDAERCAIDQNIDIVACNCDCHKKKVGVN